MARVKSDIVKLEEAGNDNSDIIRSYGRTEKINDKDVEVADLRISAVFTVASADRDNFSVDMDNLIKFYRNKLQNPQLQNVTAKAPRKPKKDQPA